MGVVPLLCALALIIVVDGVVVGGVISIRRSTDAVLQVGQCCRCSFNFCNQIIDPVHHRADGALGNVFDRAECGVYCVAEGLTGLVGRHKAGCQSCQCGHKQSHRVRGDHRIQSGLCQCQTGCTRLSGGVGCGHGRGCNGVRDLGSSGKRHISLVSQERRARRRDHRRGNADGVLELGHLLVTVEEGGDHVVELHHKVAQRRKQPAGQLAGQGGHVILQGGHAAAEGLAGFQHAVVKLPALTGGGLHCILQLFKADPAVRDALVQVGHALTGGVTNLVQRVKARVDHHVNVFQRDLLGTGHFAVGTHQHLQLVRIAKGDIAQLLQHAGGVIGGNAELQQGLGALGQVGQGKGRGCRHFAQLGKLGSGQLLVAQHDLEVGQVAFHAGVVVHAALDHLAQFGCGLFCKVRDHVSGGNGPFAGALFRRVAVEPYLTGDAEICHLCPPLIQSAGTRAQALQFDLYLPLAGGIFAFDPHAGCRGRAHRPHGQGPAAVRTGHRHPLSAGSGPGMPHRVRQRSGQRRHLLSKMQAGQSALSARRNAPAYCPRNRQGRRCASP